MKMTKAQKAAFQRFQQDTAERSGNTTLEFKRTVSRGRDTYGYTIITLYANGVRVARCIGGGYDMCGTVLGDYIAARFQAELMAISDRANYEWSNDGGNVRKDGDDKLYGMTLYRFRHADGNPIRVELDGACGFSSMERILEAIGYHLSNLKTTGREIYLLGPNQQEGE